MHLTDTVYRRSPLRLQNIMVSSFGLYWHWLRFGGSYKDHLKEYENRNNYSLDEWQCYQQQIINELLTDCAMNVPYYRQTWTQNQLSAAKHGELHQLPLLEKEPLRAHPEMFINEGIKPFPKLHFFTSGTTGTPITSYFTVSELRNTIALREARSANWAGVSFRDPRATISGRIVEPDPESKGPYYRYNSVEKQVYFSAFHIRPDTADRYLEALYKHKIVWMTGYAVSYYLLAKYILQQKLSVPPLKAIITTSEKLTIEMSDVIEEAFRCRVYEEYSTVENALFASECEMGQLHISPDVGVVEILRPDGSPCEPGEVGEVVVTCLMRSYQPLIRFRLGDLAAYGLEPCPCGRHMPVLKEVVGRLEDVVTGPDGRQMVRFHGIFVDQPHVLEGQIVQKKLDLILVKVVPTIDYSDRDTADIIARIQQRLGERVAVQVELVHHIPRTSSGKFKAVISEIQNK